MQIKIIQGIDYQLKDVPIGNIFLYKNKAYMRIQPIRISDILSYNALSLVDGTAIELNLCTHIIKCNATLQIEMIK